MVPVGPAFYPRIVLGITAMFSLALIVGDLWWKRKRAPDAGTPPNYALVVLAFGIFAAYVVLLPYLGFRLSTFLFLLAMPVALERPANARRWIVVVIVALVATVAVYYLFEQYLHVLMPRGRWTGF